MNEISEYHSALAHYLSLKAQENEDADGPDADLTQATWAVERTFKAAVNDALGLGGHTRTGAF